MNKSLIVLILFSIIACNQSEVKKGKDDNASTGKLVSTVYQITPEYNAEVLFNNSTGEINVFINDRESAATLKLPDEYRLGHPVHIIVDDYNFDNYKDFAIVEDAENKLYHVNLFDKETENFISSHSFTNLSIDNDKKELIETLKKSDVEKHSTIYFITGNYEVGTKAYITELAYGIYKNIDNGPIGTLVNVRETVWYNRSASALKELELLSSSGELASYVIQSKRTYLYNSPSLSAKTSMYLIKGDKVELMDIAKGFFKIKFRNPKYGDIVKWIKYGNGSEE
ncbi:MAG: hypothetical protein LBL90_04890 [Prevotellaceae bacterium]|jgi:hypothetical protein|nr:hypothetical protein [Prevotellaceae bacterium]